jgi:uncharacterized protein YjbI with pentapeptide repeats
MATVFMSYRRSDALEYAGRIYDALTVRLGRRSVFMDVDDIPPGIDFRSYVERAITESSVVLAIIGPHWLESRSSDGRRRLDDANDSVRVEIETALRYGLPLIPVLVGDASMPLPESLPQSLLPLVRRNAIAVRSDPDFHRDVERLVSMIAVYDRREKGRAPGSASEPGRVSAPVEEPGAVDAGLPSNDRRRQLEEAYSENVAAGQSPYADVEITSPGEVLWIMRERNWSGELSDTGRQPADFSRARLVGIQLNNIHLQRGNFEEADLSGAALQSADLRETRLDGARLNGADLSGAQMEKATLRGAALQNSDLQGANLEEARFSDADLTGADLRQARLDGATFERAHLETASLRATSLNRANLSGASLEGADFGSAALADAIIDSVSVLGGILVDARTQLDRVAWGGIRQKDHGSVKGARQRVAMYRDIARQNRRIAVALRGQGLLADASRYRLKEQRMERRALFWEGRLGAWLFSWLLDLVAGYGEQPARAFRAYLIIVLGFAGVYLWVTHSVETKLSHLTWDEAIVLSLTSFHGRGFFPGTLPLGDWIARLAAGEAVIGLFIELAFIATFSRRFLGS